MDNKSQDDLAVLLIGPGASPLPKIEEEAVALLVACNSLLNSLALQGAPIPKALLTDLTIFCRNGVGFGVPFADVAKRGYPTDHGIDVETHLSQLGIALRVQGQQADDAIADMLREPADISTASRMLGIFAEMELIRERICGYFGWSRVLINARARMSVDQREAAEQAQAKGRLN